MNKKDTYTRAEVEELLERHEEKLLVKMKENHTPSFFDSTVALGFLVFLLGLATLGMFIPA